MDISDEDYEKVVKRLQNNFSQNKVADYLGISRQMYMKYESGETGR